MWIKDQWNRLPETWQKEIVSGCHTVITAMVLELAAQISVGAGVIPTSREALVALAAVIVRSGSKALAVYVSSQVKPQQ